MSLIFSSSSTSSSFVEDGFVGGRQRTTLLEMFEEKRSKEKRSREKKEKK
ncbi:MAG: hypothetical protein N3F04_05725 [Candidatus Nezhaarchaeota archaeon]|nr:hypothetical protein [Candidatus Nezhaarchaeota archaeon]MCX8142241.1 hypothetical protein [Candidatus Nezhaarchaeota archaeon]MDW8050786.1 hypothetical protein [Nitrososphaerota archaeon]